jgi:hypothetical protein
MELQPLLEGLSTLRDRAADGELAYLCLSGKSENHLRDLVAFQIARAHPTWTVRREVEWVDLSIRDEDDAGLDIEFKVGYACVVAASGENSKIVQGAILDAQKRGRPIVSCMGLMHFEGTYPTGLEKFRNPHLVGRALRNPMALSESRDALNRIWSDRPIEFVQVRCGSWDDIAVSIDFAVVRQDASSGSKA